MDEGRKDGRKEGRKEWNRGGREWMEWGRLDGWINEEEGKLDHCLIY